MLKSKPRLAPVLLILVILLLSITVASAQEREKIEVWIGHDSWAPYLLHFNEVQDRYEVEFLIQGSGDALIAAVAAGTPPDVFRSGSLLNFAALGVLQPLDEYIERDGVDTSAFIPGIMNSLIWQGKTYGLPLNGDSHLVYYNMDRFEEAGLDSTQPPTTWSELEAAARQLVHTGPNGQIERLGFSWWSRSVDVTFFTHQQGVRMFTPDLNDIAFDTPTTQRTIDWLVDSQNTINGGQAAVEAFATLNNDLSDAFVNGSLGMYLREPYMIARTRNENPEMNFGVFPLPRPDDGGEHVNLSGGHRVTIPVGAKNPEGAWEFIKWLTSYEAGIEFAEPGFTQRYIPQVYQGIGQSMSARIDVNLAAPFFRETPLWRDFAQDMVYALDWPVHPLHDNFFSLLFNNTTTALRQEVSSGEALVQAAHQARAALSDWRSR